MNNSLVFQATIDHLLPDGILENEIVITFHPEDRSFTLVLATREKTATIEGFCIDFPSDMIEFRQLIERHVDNASVKRRALDFIDQWI